MPGLKLEERIWKRVIKETDRDDGEEEKGYIMPIIKIAVEEAFKCKMPGLKQRIEKMKGSSPIKTKYGTISWGRENVVINRVLTELKKTKMVICKLTVTKRGVLKLKDVLKALDSEEGKK